MAKLTVTFDPKPPKNQGNSTDMKELVKKAVERVKYKPEKDPSLKRLEERLNNTNGKF
ncbi:hypothetical protein [Brevibacillus sp. MS2.2]|uniref:hypothetical protein n=1 Tax=Brevibacillus sp. MS2.2 TaxID=2738981 RepID=UPI00156A7675|nr:hypothetical protein [Brevibacillus sp. MS2.2]NRR21354.1 hypothetical protein [Brevibacillus sp. MS2.2]